jgi:hypothetical protein
MYTHNLYFLWDQTVTIVLSPYSYSFAAIYFVSIKSLIINMVLVARINITKSTLNPYPANVENRMSS